MMGGKESIDFLAPSGSGENTLVTCENGDFAADLEIARGIPRAPAVSRKRSTRPKEVATPGVTTIEALAEMLGIDAAATSKAMPVVKTDGTLVLGLVRGDDRLSEPKMLGVARAATTGRRRTRRSAPRSAPAAARSARSASTSRSSPTRRCARGSSSPARTATAGTCSASRRDATTSRASPTSARPARATRAPSAAARSASRPRSRSATSSSSATRYSDAARGDVPRRGRHGEAADRRELRHRPGARHGGRRRAVARRERHRVAGVDRAVRRPRARAARRRGGGARRRPRRSRRRSTRRASTCCSTTATSAPERSSRTRISSAARCASSSGRRRSTTARWTFGAATARREDRVPVVRRAEMGQARLMARRRRYSDDPFGPTIERLMDGDGHDLSRARRQGGSLRRLPEPHRPREPPGAVERRHRADRRRRSASSRSTSASTGSASSPRSSRRCPSSSTACTSASPRRPASRPGPARD